MCIHSCVSLDECVLVNIGMPGNQRPLQVQAGIKLLGAEVKGS